MSIITSIIGGISQEQQARITLALQQDQNITNLLVAQANIDANEASNPNLFVSGWRPMIGWGLGVIVVGYAFLTLFINFAITLGYHFIQFPPLDPMVRDIIMGMLGLNIGARTYEKINLAGKRG